MNRSEIPFFDERVELKDSVQQYERYLANLRYYLPTDLYNDIDVLDSRFTQYGAYPYTYRWFEIQKQAQLLKNPTPNYGPILRWARKDNANHPFLPNYINGRLIANDYLLAKGRLSFFEAQDFHKQAEREKVTWYQLAYQEKNKTNSYPFERQTEHSLDSLPTLYDATFGSSEISSRASSASSLLLFNNYEESLPESELLRYLDTPAQERYYYGSPEQRLANLVLAGVLDITNPFKPGQMQFRLRSLQEFTHMTNIGVIKILDKFVDDPNIKIANREFRQGVMPETIEAAETLLSSQKNVDYFISHAYATNTGRVQALSYLINTYRENQHLLQELNHL